MEDGRRHPAGFTVVVGRWYVASYGCARVTGPCLSVTNAGAVLAFRWGTFWRERHFIPSFAIVAEVPAPLIIRIWRRFTQGRGIAL